MYENEKKRRKLYYFSFSYNMLGKCIYGKMSKISIRKRELSHSYLNFDGVPYIHIHRYQRGDS